MRVLSRMDRNGPEHLDCLWENVNDKKIPVSVFHYELTESAYADITESGSKFLWVAGARS